MPVSLEASPLAERYRKQDKPARMPDGFPEKPGRRKHVCWKQSQLPGSRSSAGISGYRVWPF
jgi:hypothetical protein